MNRIGCVLIGACLVGGSAIAQAPPVLRGQVKHLNEQVVAHTAIRLLEPDVEGITDADGLFKIPLPASWTPGDVLTVSVGLSNYEVVRPWNGRLTVQAEAHRQIESILITQRELAQLVHNPPALELILQREVEAAVQRDSSADGSALDVLEAEARRLNTTLPELVALLNEWKEHAARRGTVYEQALAALYEKKYGEAIRLLQQDIAANVADIARADSLKALLPRKYTNLGLAHAGRYEHAAAVQAYKQALAIDPNYSRAYHLLGVTYRFTGKLDSALVYYRQSLALERELGRPEGMANALGNIGNVYKTQGRLDSALVYYRQSLALERELH